MLRLVSSSRPLIPLKITYPGCSDNSDRIDPDPISLSDGEMYYSINALEDVLRKTSPPTEGEKTRPPFISPAKRTPSTSCSLLTNTTVTGVAYPRSPREIRRGLFASGLRETVTRRPPSLPLTLYFHPVHRVRPGEYRWKVLSGPLPEPF